MNDFLFCFGWEKKNTHKATLSVNDIWHYCCRKGTFNMIIIIKKNPTHLVCIHSMRLSGRNKRPNKVPNKWVMHTANGGGVRMGGKGGFLMRRWLWYYQMVGEGGRCVGLKPPVHKNTDVSVIKGKTSTEHPQSQEQRAQCCSAVKLTRRCLLGNA